MVEYGRQENKRLSQMQRLVKGHTSKVFRDGKNFQDSTGKTSSLKI